MAPLRSAGVERRRSAAWRLTSSINGAVSTTATLERLVVDLTWNPASLVTLEATLERNVGELPWGDFAQTVVGTRLRLNVSPNLNVSSVVQYDDISDSVGTNTRLRWTFRPQGDLFVVYNHNVRDLQDRFGFDSNQLVVKMQYAFIY